jgi:hypothetical protein
MSYVIDERCLINVVKVLKAVALGQTLLLLLVCYALVQIPIPLPFALLSFKISNKVCFPLFYQMLARI